MTADIVKDQIAKDHIPGQIKAKITEFGHHPGPSGFELSRLQNFLEGRQDIFDILEQHTANTEKAEPVARKSHATLYESAGVFELLMDDMKLEFARIAGFCARRLSLLKKGIDRSHLI